MSNRKACREVETVKLKDSSRRQQLVQVATKARTTPATCLIRHVEATCRTLLRLVECCRSTYFCPFDMSKQIEHVQFLSTCQTIEQQVAVKEAGVDDFVDTSNVHQYSYHVWLFQLLFIYCSRDVVFVLIYSRPME